MRRSMRFASVALCVSLLTTSAIAKSARDEREKKAVEMPHCAKSLGTIAVSEPENQWWRQFQLESPEALIRIFVRESGCFNMVNRGKGFAVAQQERALASSGELRGGSNLGKGQVKAADYVLIPDIVSKNSNAGGFNAGGIIGGLLGSRTAGAVLGGINIKKREAEVVLTVMDVRSSEEMASINGYAKKSDLGWGAGGGMFSGGGFGAAGAGGYANTDIGQVITMAYLDAYTKLVGQFGGLPDSAKEASVSQAVTMKRPGRLYTTADIKSKVVKDIDAGAMLYPTGNKQELMWEVEDELGTKGWVSSTLLELSK